jgi:hypothetical protein
VVKDILVTFRRINASVCAGARNQNKKGSSIFQPSIRSVSKRRGRRRLFYFYFYFLVAFFCFVLFLGFVNREIG